ncbi:GNAT family N-acetyltransferase [Aquamicrobium sp. LC103]|uniref:GNAT family N-acetyltransferase n=1 Tax=Aquamicrobium sp. LC103 TaxID=1120658 RepID=UPI00063E7F7D|nr:GNAT family N-acetyltransferase [Aquamicrobium sp. LC103]TKT80272.1 GNAT family N-acetyltransferase [Aquamicrobium sp. LC103]
MLDVPRQPEAATRAPATEPVVTVARSRQAVECLREAWAALPVTNIDSDIDYFLTVVRHAPRVVAPHVVHIRREGSDDLLGVARLEELPVKLRLGRHAIGRFTLRAIVFSFDGIVGTAGEADERLLLAEYLKALDAGVADVILMRNVDVAGSLRKTARAMAGRLRWGHARSVSSRWIADIPDRLETFLQVRSAKSRNTLRRQERNLHANFADRMKLSRFDRPEELQELCRDLESVAARSYQRGLGVSYTGTPLEHGLIELGLRRGWHRAWVLYIDGAPVAFWNGMAYGDTFAIGTPGFDPRYTKDSVGIYTMLRMTEDLCADPAIGRLDFGQGEAEYKSAFGRRSHDESEIMIAAPRLRAIALLLALSGVSALNDLAARAIRDTSWGRRLKAGWRRRAAEKASS